MIKKQILYILAVLFMVSLTAGAVSADDAIIGIGDGVGEVTLPITITGSTNVGGIELNLTYDESVVIVTSAEEGDMSDTTINLEHVDDGWIRIVAYQSGVTLGSDFVLAAISFAPVGNSGSCLLELDVTTFGESTPAGDAMPYTISNGMYTIDPIPTCPFVFISTEDLVDVYIDDVVSFEARCTNHTGDEIECSELTWISDNETVGTMDGSVFTANASGTANVSATGCVDPSNEIQVNVTVAPNPDPTPTTTTRRSSRDGTYPPDPTPTPDVDDSTDNETDQDDPKPAATKTADVKPTVNLPGGDTTLDTTPDDEDDAPDGTDPTSAIFIVLGILALIVIGYVLYRKSQNGE